MQRIVGERGFKKMIDIKRLVEICKNRKIYIQTHNFPDADAVFTARGLQYILSLYGIETEIVYNGPIQRVNLLRAIDMFQVNIREVDGGCDDRDAIILVDCQAEENNVSCELANVIACIDHHSTENNHEYEYKYKVISGSCSTHIVELIEESGIECPEDILNGLYYGLVTDTLSFSRGVTDLDIKEFRFLNSRIDKEKINYLRSSSIELEDLKAFGSVIQNIMTVSDIGISYVPFDCPDGLVAVLSEFILGVDDLNVAIVFSHRADGVKVSVRSITSLIHAGAFVRNALQKIGGNGGGHQMFSGGFIPKDVVDKYEKKEFTDILTRVFLDEYSLSIMDSVKNV